MSNPNDCSTCEWIADDGKGHCYMFFDEPTEICMQHTGKKVKDDLNIALEHIGLALKPNPGDLTAITAIMGRITPLICDCGEADFGDGVHYKTCPVRRGL